MVESLRSKIRLDSEQVLNLLDGRQTSKVQYIRWGERKEEKDLVVYGHGNTPALHGVFDIKKKKLISRRTLVRIGVRPLERTLFSDHLCLQLQSRCGSSRQSNKDWNHCVVGPDCYSGSV